MKEKWVLVLEDDGERVARFERTLREMGLGLTMKVWASARVMMREVEAYLDEAVLISLDHDLYVPRKEMEDPGDGLELAKFLAVKRPRCAVIIHSSNADRSGRMSGEFDLEGWRVRLVMPFGEKWVEEYWKRAVIEMLGTKGV